MVGVSVVFILYAVHAAIRSSNKDYPQNGSKYGELIGRTLHQLRYASLIFDYITWSHFVTLVNLSTEIREDSHRLRKQLIY